MSEKGIRTHLSGNVIYPPNGIIVGDPDRALFIANFFFKNVKLLNKARGLIGYKGIYNHQEFFVQSTGMGGPSAAITLHEITKLGAKNIIRVGTCFSPFSATLGKIFSIKKTYLNDGTSLAYSKKKFFIRERWINASMSGGKVNACSTDTFYDFDHREKITFWKGKKISAVDMETSTFYVLSEPLGYQALSILIVSDRISSGKEIEYISPNLLKKSVIKATQFALKELSHD